MHNTPNKALQLTVNPLWPVRSLSLVVRHTRTEGRIEKHLTHESSTPMQTPHQEEPNSTSAKKESLGTPPRTDQQLKLIMSWVVVVVLTLFGAVALVGLFTVGRTEGTFWRDRFERTSQ